MANVHTKTLLMNFIRMALAEQHLARVPNQLIEPDQNMDAGNKEDEVEEVNEFCAMAGGGVAGFSAPLGMKPDEPNRQKNKTKRSK